MDQNYSIREISEEEFKPLFDKHKKAVFGSMHSYNLLEVQSPAELKQMKQLGQGLGIPYKLYFGVFDNNNKFVGWSCGTQESASTFYMVSSGILAGHRRKGLYSAVLRRCMETLSKKGFQLIYSRHCATNNDIIIPKLKAGFIISKMEIDDKYGVLIHLHFYTNHDRRKIMDYRSGQLSPTAKIKKVFKIQ